jgi:formylglycine-generating enzyme required for sulfatase activity
MPEVFISYVHENTKEVQRLCDELTKHGVKVWLDRNAIAPGTRWKQAIRKAISQGDFFIACFSKEYHNRSKTYVNEELNLAIEELRQRPADRAWFIPVLLSECEVPDLDIGPGETLRDIQWVALYEDWNTGIQRILSVIQKKRSKKRHLPQTKISSIDGSVIQKKRSKKRHLPQTKISPMDGAEMVLIPAGEFLMGSPKGEGDSDEYPQHTVYLDAFYIDKYEVTNAQYKKFMDATGHAAPGYWNDNSFNKPEQPVVGVNWFDAEAYCKWANKRLPTEAEWEKAARGTDARKYPWGNEEPNAGGIWRANYNIGKKGADDGFQFTAPVGSFSAGVSPYGIHDMAGNVWEWCADWYDKYYYSGSLKNNPKGPSKGRSRVVRGGSWLDVGYYLRAANRGKCVIEEEEYFNRTTILGFRCAQDIQ